MRVRSHHQVGSCVYKKSREFLLAPAWLVVILLAPVGKYYCLVAGRIYFQYLLHNRAWVALVELMVADKAELFIINGCRGRKLLIIRRAKSGNTYFVKIVACVIKAKLAKVERVVVSETYRGNTSVV